MKDDELLKPYGLAPFLEQTQMLLSPEPSKQKVPPPESLDGDETLYQLRAVKAGVATHDHSAQVRAMTSVTPLLDSDIVDEPIEVEKMKREPLPLETLPLPAFHLRYITIKNVNRRLHRKSRTDASNLTTSNGVSVRQARSGSQGIKAIDIWLIAVFILACIASGVSFWYFFATHQTLLYGDADAHLLIARRVFDNLTPGLAQLGGIWLPLPHLLMIPFIWNDFLWRSGLAGSIVSMLSYLVATVYIFLSARCLTKNSFASFIGTLVFILNPNILYLQSTPLSELVLMATLAGACYYFVVWVQTDTTKYLIFTAGATFFATLARYDGWFLFATILVLIPLVGRVRRHGWPRIEGSMLLFGSMGSLGIILWFVWNLLIFGDPLYFQHGAFSAQAQQKDLIRYHLLYTYHDLFQSVRYYLIDCIDIVGPVLFGIGVFALVLFLVKRRFKPEMFAAFSFLSPLSFYITSLYTGQASLYLPTAVPGYAPYTLFNARYGEVIVMPVAIFLACLVGFFAGSRQRSSMPRFFVRNLLRGVGRYVLPLICLGIVVGQSAWITSTGIITQEDGLYGLACTPTHRIAIYMAEHYNGGRILEDLYTSKVDTLEITAGIDFKNVIYEGSGQLWTNALAHPQSVVDWIVVNPTDPTDAITEKIDLQSDKFTSQFDFVVQEETGVALYLRKGLPPLPTHEVPRSVFTEHQQCGERSPSRFGNLPGLPDQEGIIGKAGYL